MQERQRCKPDSPLRDHATTLRPQQDFRAATPRNASPLLALTPVCPACEPLEAEGLQRQDKRRAPAHTARHTLIHIQFKNFLRGEARLVVFAVSATFRRFFLPF